MLLHQPNIIYLVILLFLICDNYFYNVNGQESESITKISNTIEDIQQQDWLMTCCGDAPLRRNRTLVTLGYLTAVTKLHGR